LINERKIRSASRLLKYSLSELRDTKNQFDTYNEDFLSAVDHARRNLKKETRDYEKFKEQSGSSGSTEPADKNKVKEETIKKDKEDPITETVNDMDSLKSTVDPVYRKLYKKIAMKTHPDRMKTMSWLEDYEKDALVSIFQEARSSLENADKNGLLCSACEVDIDLMQVGFNEDDLLRRLQKQAKKSSENLNSISRNYIWSWGETKDIVTKTKILQAYMQHLGYPQIPESLLRDVIDTYRDSTGRSRRKVGKRPKRLIRR